MSAPWSVRAFAFSRNVSLWDSICFLYLSLEALNFPLVTTAQGSGHRRPYAILLQGAACLLRSHLSVLRGGRELPWLRAALSLHCSSCWRVSHIVQRTHFGLGLLLEVQLLVLDFDISSPWLMLNICFRAALGGHFGEVHFLVLDLHIPTSRDMLNIVLGTTLGLNMAVVRFFGDYLDFPIGLFWDTLFCYGCFSWSHFRDHIGLRLSGSSG